MTLTDELTITFTDETHEKKCEGSNDECPNVAVGRADWEHGCHKGCKGTKLYCLEHIEMLAYMNSTTEGLDWFCTRHRLLLGKLIYFGRF